MDSGTLTLWKSPFSNRSVSICFRYVPPFSMRELWGGGGGVGGGGHIVSPLSIRTYVRPVRPVRPVRNTNGFRAISFEKISVFD